VYPFERFTERAKKVLTLAQEEAERSHHSYIGTEHLLLGLLREGDGLAAKVLTNLGVEIARVRQTIESLLVQNERLIIQQIVPTSRVKKVIEISFEEARRMGNNYVGTEHMLLGLLIEGEGIAAHVLIDLGATLDKVRAELERLLQDPAAREPEPGKPVPGPQLAADTVAVLRLATELAQSEGAKETGVAHLQRVLSSTEASRYLELDARLRQLVSAKQSAIERQDFEAAARYRDEENQLRQELPKAHERWRRTLKRRPKSTS
jgi:ATP-dependent Clp protease ATP-binding subunit ClpA